MKANRPSLVLYFTACVLVVVFKIMEFDTLMPYTKSMIIPLAFMYYLITNNYKITWIRALVFLSCFVGDVIVLLKFYDSIIGGLLSFLIVYLLLLKISIDDFRKMKFRKEDGLSMVVSLFFIATICITVLSLKFEKIKPDFYLFVIYGIVLSFLSFFSVTNYLKKGSYYFLNFLLMTICFVLSDVFFIIYEFYLKLYAFSFICIIAQIISYYFMVIYFIEIDKHKRRIRK